MTPEMLMLQIMNPHFRQNGGALPQMLANAAALLERQKRQSADVQSPATSVDTPPSSQASAQADQPETTNTSPTSSSEPPVPQDKTTVNKQEVAENSPNTKKRGFDVSDLLFK